MIEIKNITKKYNNNIALNDISFIVNKGEILGFLGPNGAGKTTTMKLITSFLDADSGSIEVDGLDTNINSIETRKKIGYLPEMVPLYDELLVYEYLNFVAEIREIPKNEIKQRVKNTMSECGLMDVATRPIEELSKGYRQRVGLAQAIIHRPDILILDEPTTGLDPNQIIEIRNLIKKIGKEKTIIFSTHILSEANAISDKIIIINGGKIVASGTPQELQQNTLQEILYRVIVKGDRTNVLNALNHAPNIERVKIIAKEKKDIYRYEIKPSTKDDIREAIFDIISNSNFKILELSRKKVSLGDIFRELTKK